MVGDFAFVLDPLYGHRIIKAIMSGMMTGYLISKIINNHFSEEKVATYYKKWIYGWFEKEVKILRNLYSYAPGWI